MDEATVAAAVVDGVLGVAVTGGGGGLGGVVIR